MPEQQKKVVFLQRKVFQVVSKNRCLKSDEKAHEEVKFAMVREDALIEEKEKSHALSWPYWMLQLILEMLVNGTPHLLSQGI